MNDALPNVHLEVRACHRQCSTCPSVLMLSVPGPGGAAFASTDDVVDTAAKVKGWLYWAGSWHCEGCVAVKPWIAEVAERAAPMSVVGFSDRDLEQMRAKAAMRDATWRGRR